jgi:hypothetical protein
MIGVINSTYFDVKSRDKIREIVKTEYIDISL